MNEWISVKDRLPEPFVSVLLYAPEISPLPTVIEGYMCDYKFFYGVRPEIGMVWVGFWMPMPEPPKEET